MKPGVWRCIQPTIDTTTTLQQQSDWEGHRVALVHETYGCRSLYHESRLRTQRFHPRTIGTGIGSLALVAMDGMGSNEEWEVNHGVVAKTVFRMLRAKEWNRPAVLVPPWKVGSYNGSGGVGIAVHIAQEQAATAYEIKLVSCEQTNVVVAAEIVFAGVGGRPGRKSIESTQSSCVVPLTERNISLHANKNPPSSPSTKAAGALLNQHRLLLDASKARPPLSEKTGMRNQIKKVVATPEPALHSLAGLKTDQRVLASPSIDRFKSPENDQVATNTELLLEVQSPIVQADEINRELFPAPRNGPSKEIEHLPEQEHLHMENDDDLVTLHTPYLHDVFFGQESDRETILDVEFVDESFADKCDEPIFFHNIIFGYAESSTWWEPIVSLILLGLVVLGFSFVWQYIGGLTTPALFCELDVEAILRGEGFDMATLQDYQNDRSWFGITSWLLPSTAYTTTTYLDEIIGD